jgi:hypothetical protein
MARSDLARSLVVHVIKFRDGSKSVSLRPAMPTPVSYSYHTFEKKTRFQTGRSGSGNNNERSLYPTVDACVRCRRSQTGENVEKYTKHNS